MRKLFVLSALSAIAGSAFTGCGDASAARTTADSAQVQAGLAQLRAGNAAAAENEFRQILQRTPTHYGAKYQLAVALDRGGKPSEARTLWEEMKGMAEAAGDSATLRTVVARLAAPDTIAVDVLMQTGLTTMYQQNNPAGAAATFREILARNPTHYGATYQLATALDRSGQRGQARPLWEKVLGMAVSFKDQATIETARTRLRSAN